MKKKGHGDSPVTSITLKPKCMNITTVHCLKCKSAVACPSLYRLKIKLCLNDDSLLFIVFDGFVEVVGSRCEYIENKYKSIDKNRSTSMAIKK